MSDREPPDGEPSSADGEYDDLSPEPPLSEPDSQAEREAAGFALGIDLSNARAIAALNRIVRKDALEGLVGTLVQALVVLAAGLVALCAIVLVYHFIAPDGWLFLSAERIEDLKDFLFSGTVGAALAQLARGRLTEEKNDDE